MVDYQSKFRMYGYGYTSPVLRFPIATHRELYHETAPHFFKRRPKAHDCGLESMQDFRDRRDWETWLFSQGLNATCRSVDDLHFKDLEKRPKTPSKKVPDKLITTIGIRGSGDGDFQYPRGLTTNVDSDILVADSGNNRVQVINSYGVFKKKFGTKGTGKGQFDEPTGSTELPNGDIAVADKNNKRVQVFHANFEYKYEFKTTNKPYCIDSDRKYNIIVGTTTRTIEIYRRGGKLVHTFSIGARTKGLQCGFQFCVNEKDEVVVCDPADSYVKFYTYDGRILYRFQPLSNNEGLTMMPGAICRTPIDQYIIADILNHTVSLYTERGVLLQQLLNPTDEAGAVQTCALGPEGHLIVTEFSVVGEHCLKIFRYRNSDSRPSSSKRRTPTTPV